MKDKISFNQNPAKRFSTDLIKKILESLFQEKTIYIKYHKSEFEKTDERTLDAYHLRYFEGNWYLIAYAHNRKKIRVISVNRIESVKLSKRDFYVPEGFNAEDYFAYSFGKKRTSKIIEIKLEINKNSVRRILEKSIHHTQQTKLLKNGNVLVSLKLNELSEIKDWLMTKGSSIKVKSPGELIDMIKIKSSSLLQLYK